MKRHPVILIVLAMAASLLLVYGFSAVLSGGESPDLLAAAQMKGKMAHEFTLPTIDSKTIRLSDLRGRVVVLNFWATWCGPCKVEMPAFMELQKEYGPQGLQVIGVDVNDTAAVEDVAAFARGMGIEYPILVGKRDEQDAIASDYGGIAFLPETVFITRDGKVSEKTIGLRSKSEIEASIRKALAEGPISLATDGGSAVKRVAGEVAPPKPRAE